MPQAILSPGHTPKPWEPTRVPPWPGLLAPVAIQLLNELGVCASVNTTRDQWLPLNAEPNVTAFEYAYGIGSRRWAYNARMKRQALEARRGVLGSHAGFSDLFVPIQDEKTLGGMLVAGPFATARPSSGEILQRWHEMTSTAGKVSDPTFGHYLSTTLSTLTLDKQELDAFEEMTRCLAVLLANRGDVDTLTAGLEAARAKLLPARLAERMWRLVRTILDGQGSRAWDVYGELQPFGLEVMPSHVLVGLIRSRGDGFDPVTELLARDELLRACVRLCQRLGGVVSAGVGTSAVAFLLAHKGPKSQLRPKLLDVATRARSLARKHGFDLFVGVSEPLKQASMRERYDSAAGAAEKALSRNQAVVYGEPQREPAIERLGDLRSELADSATAQPELLIARFDRYVEAVLAHTGYRLDATLAHLEAGVGRLGEPLRASGFLDAKGHRELCRTMQQVADRSASVQEARAAYQSIVTGIADALEHPVKARQARGSERALSYIKENLSDRLSLTQVARVSGYAPAHLSALLKREQGLGFAALVKKLRLEHAMRMLEVAKLSVDQIQNLCGFQNRSYFHRAFKQATGSTPAAYRSARRGSRPGRRAQS